MAGFIWLIPVFVDLRFVGAVLAWDVLVLAVWLADLWLLPKPSALRVRRTWLAPAALSVESTVELVLINQSPRTVRVRLLDAVPAQLRATPPEQVLTVEAATEGASRYAVTPMARGGTPIGAVYLRYQSLLGFAERWAVADLAQTIITYPNLADAKRHAVSLIRSRQITLEKRSSRIRGAGSAFESLREYREGDELRHVCWTASARRGKPVTRVFEIERSQSIWMLIDSGRLMRARVAGLSKLDYAVNAALALAQVALGSGDQVGLIAYGRRIEQRAPAARGAAHLRRIVNQLAAVREDEGEADHVLAAGRLLADQKRRGLVVWITDVAETSMTPEVIRAAAHLMTRHVVLFVVIGDRELQTLARPPAAQRRRDVRNRGGSGSASAPRRAARESSRARSDGARNAAGGSVAVGREWVPGREAAKQDLTNGLHSTERDQSAFNQHGRRLRRRATAPISRKNERKW